METKKILKQGRMTITYTVLAVFLLCSVFMLMVGYIYNDAENMAFEQLHNETLTIKENLNLQFASDVENLTTMAGFASKLYSDGEGYDLLFDSFKPIGLIKEIGILMPNDTLVTKEGSTDVRGKLSFSEEVHNSNHISGRITDVTTEKTELVRCSVPINSNGRTVGILYGAVRLNYLDDKYREMAKNHNAELFVAESGNGNLIIDTLDETPKNIDMLQSYDYKDNFSFEKLISDIDSGKPGYTAFKSQANGKYSYAHYAPLAISDWYIMLLQPEEIVFSEARATRNTMFMMFMLAVVIMSTYLLSIYKAERKQSSITFIASKIRKLLLGINQQSVNIEKSLENITVFANSRSAFFVDSDGEDYNYIIPSLKGRMLTNDDRSFFVSALFEYAQKYYKKRSIAVLVFNITANSKLHKNHLKLYEFLKDHNINQVCFAVITDKNQYQGIIGVINPKRFMYVATSKLLKDIAVCFSMAIYNKKHLNKTEYMATTDSLTGISNRVAYNNDISHFKNDISDSLACVYVDANELHAINNKYGHAAGDSMLIYIADCIKRVFENQFFYRMGGDEFLIFTENISENDINKYVDELINNVEEEDYNISVGVSFRRDYNNIEDLVKAAEKKMYEAKAEYYQRKSKKSISAIEKRCMNHIVTGIKEIDATLDIMSLQYFGIYFVSLDTDTATKIMMPTYFPENDNGFSINFARYVDEMVNREYHRAMIGFLNYDALKKQLQEGNTPSIVYERLDGEPVKLSIHALQDNDNNSNNTIWLFENIK